MLPRRRASLRLWRAAAVAAAILLPTASAQALGFPGFHHSKSQPKAQEEEVVGLLAQIDQALDERRLVDAGRMLDEAFMSQISDPRLLLRSGELHLARGRYQDAIQSFSDAAKSPSVKAQALQGKGIALAQLGRSDEATTSLNAAVQADPSLWRAWNALGVEADRHHDFTASEADYANAIKAPGVKAYVYNNRGYSRLLQGRYADASADFVKALELKPDLAQARTNLRLSLALRGKYSEATEISGVEDRGAVLNNAGFAAVMRGDLNEAENLFQQAVEAHTSSYGRALENLKMVKAMKASPPVGTAHP